MKSSAHRNYSATVQYYRSKGAPAAGLCNFLPFVGGRPGPTPTHSQNCSWRYPVISMSGVKRKKHEGEGEVEDRRERKNKREKERRATVNILLDNLVEVLGIKPDTKADKVSILSCAITTIKKLRANCKCGVAAECALVIQQHGLESANPDFNAEARACRDRAVSLAARCAHGEDALFAADQLSGFGNGRIDRSKRGRSVSLASGQSSLQVPHLGAAAASFQSSVPQTFSLSESRGGGHARGASASVAADSTAGRSRLTQRRREELIRQFDRPRRPRRHSWAGLEGLYVVAAAANAACKINS